MPIKFYPNGKSELIRVLGYIKHVTVDTPTMNHQIVRLEIDLILQSPEDVERAQKLAMAVMVKLFPGK